VTAPWTVSPWLAEVEAPAPPLTGDLAVDVAVIGAGFTGLSAALALRAEGLGVAVLEGRLAGHGASGRNAGHLTPTIGKDLPTLAWLYGRERARALVSLAEAAIAHTEALIREHAIACDYEPVGNIFASVHPAQDAAVDRAARAAADLGAPGVVLEPDEMRRRDIPAAFRRGFLEPSGGVLNPGRYVRGLRRAALAAGAALFEETPVLRIEPGPTISVSTPRGQVRARHLIVGTNAYTGEIDAPVPPVARIQVQLFMTEPLDQAALEALGWRERQGIYTAHEILESYRLTADGRIVGGSRFIRYAYGGRPLPDIDPGIAGRLEEIFRRRFPEIGVTRVARHWGGPIGFALDFLPHVGRGGPHRNVLYAIGYAGHGVALASYAGRMIADLLLEREGPGAALWARRHVPLPPEPLRWGVAKALIGLFEWMDRRADGG
jgi:glycine/D-amino acid oxidase-like deaminating enzyme